MQAVQEPNHDQTSRRVRLRWFVRLLVCVQLFFLLAGSELVVRWQQSRIRNSDRLDPGIAHYDPELGWKLTPNWTGSHRTFDFTVRYTINEAGLRADSPLPFDRRGKLVAVVGDSFAFGLGVNDDQTFVHLLNQSARDQATFVNFSVPGYSTDQEALLIERDVLRWKPDVIILAVYVANDLFDNLLDHPLQVNHAKPRFALCDGRLVLTNVPVPVRPKPVEMHRLGHDDPADQGVKMTEVRYPGVDAFELTKMIAACWLGNPTGIKFCVSWSDQTSRFLGWRLWFQTLGCWALCAACDAVVVRAVAKSRSPIRPLPLAVYQSGKSLAIFGGWLECRTKHKCASE